MSNASSYLWDFHFTLSEECSFHQIEGPPGIRLEKRNNNDGTKSVYAFIVRVKSPTEEEALVTIDKQAEKLVDILAVLPGKYLGYTLNGHVMISPDDSRTVTSSTMIKYRHLPSAESADLSQGNFPKLIKTLKPKNKELHLV